MKCLPILLLFMLVSIACKTETSSTSNETNTPVKEVKELSTKELDAAKEVKSDGIEVNEQEELKKEELKPKTDNKDLNESKNTDKLKSEVPKDAQKSTVSNSSKEIKSEPKVEEPKVEEPKLEEPKVEEPFINEPTIEEPEIKEPEIVEPINEEPIKEEPVKEETSKPIVGDHDVFDALLTKYVTASGKVNYKGIKSEIESLNSYLSFLANNAPASSWNKSKALAYW
ncbi:MAG: hypothetical protein AAGK97_15435, partial [Bacteroidota bacterium]